MYGETLTISKGVVLIVGLLVMISLLYCIATNKNIFPENELLEDY